MLPAADDHVLDATGDIELTRREVRAIAGVPPFPVHQARSRLLVVKIAAGSRGTRELQGALDPLGYFGAGLIENSHAISRQGTPAGNESKDIGHVRGHRDGSTLAHHGGAIDAIDDGAATHGWKRQPHGDFRQTVHGRHRLSAKAARGETMAKAL